MRNLFLSLVLMPVCCFGQQFNASGLASPVNLDGANGSCASPGAGAPSSFNITVSGVGILSTSNALVNFIVGFTDCDGAYGLAGTDCSIRIMSPAGTCVPIYNGGLSTSFIDGETEFMLTSNASCLTIPNTSNLPIETAPGLDVNGSSGVFAASWSGVPVDFVSSFLGENADGVWRIIFSNSTTDDPCVDNLSIAFGNPTVDNQVGNGNNCVNPIVWDGGPFCTTTSGMSNSTQMPGWAGPGANTWGTFNGGATCDWNFANNNDVWIAFVAQDPLVCVNISGLGNDLQSVVVSDPNTDGDNDPCTGANGGQYWNLVSCPVPALYTTTAGTDNIQNHCFSATLGQTYYLVVDGNGGAESSFYVSGIAGTLYNLPVELINFQVICDERAPTLIWETASEYNNDYFLIQHTFDGQNYSTIGSVAGAGTTSEKLSYRFDVTNPAYYNGYFRLKQIDYNGEFEYSPLRFANCQNDEPFVQIIDGQLIVSNMENVVDFTIFDVSGRQLFTANGSDYFTGFVATSFYYVVIETKNGITNHKVFAQ